MLSVIKILTLRLEPQSIVLLLLFKYSLKMVIETPYSIILFGGGIGFHSIQELTSSSSGSLDSLRAVGKILGVNVT